MLGRNFKICLLSLGILLTLISYASASTTGVIQGKVIDQDTGKPLVGVNIFVQNSPFTTVTGKDGSYCITNVTPGIYDIQASLVGYQDATEKSVNILMDITSRVDFKLATQAIEKATKVVTGKRLRIQSTTTPTMYSVTSKEEKNLPQQPNNLYQLPGILFTQPGVVPNPSGYATIRGSDVWYLGYMVEGIPITEPITNTFATNTVTAGLDRMELYTGGTRAEYGNELAGVVNQVIKTGNEMISDGKDMGGNLDTSIGNSGYKNLNLELGGVTPKGTSWYTAGYLFGSRFERNSSFNKAPYSIDGVAKIVQPLGSKDSMTLLSMHGGAKYNLDGTITQAFNESKDDAESLNPQQAYSAQHYGLDALSFNHDFNTHSFYTARAYRLWADSIYNTLNPDNPLAAYRYRESTQNGLQLRYTNQVNPIHLIRLGLDNIWSSNYSMKFSNAVVSHEHFINDVPTVQSSAFLEDQYHPSKWWTADYGLRFEQMQFDRKYHSEITNANISPRMGVTYTRNTKTLYRASWGKFIMFPPTSLMECHFDDPSVDSWYNWGYLKPERATAFDLGIEHKLSDSLLLKATAFNTKRTDLINYTYTDDYQIQFRNGFKGHSNGLELQLQSKPVNGWTGWISYTYLRTKSSTIAEPDIYTRLSQDQRQTLYVGMTRKTKSGFIITPSLEYGTGYAYGLGLSEYDPNPSTTGDEIPIYDRDGKLASTTANTYTTDPHLCVNLMIQKPVGKNETIYLSLDNIFNVGVATSYDINGSNSYHEPDTTHPNGYFTYEPSQYIPPRFVRLGYTYQF